MIKTLAITLIFFGSSTSVLADSETYEIIPLSGDEMFKMSTQVKENGPKAESSNQQRLDIWAKIISNKTDKTEIKDSNVDR
jgi:hypothetical protein